MFLCYNTSGKIDAVLDHFPASILAKWVLICKSSYYADCSDEFLLQKKSAQGDGFGQCERRI